MVAARSGSPPATPSASGVVTTIKELVTTLASIPRSGLPLTGSNSIDLKVYPGLWKPLPVMSTWSPPLMLEGAWYETPSISGALHPLMHVMCWAVTVPATSFESLHVPLNVLSSSDTCTPKSAS